MSKSTWRHLSAVYPNQVNLPCIPTWWLFGVSQVICRRIDASQVTRRRITGDSDTPLNFTKAPETSSTTENTRYPNGH